MLRFLNLLRSSKSLGLFQRSGPIQPGEISQVKTYLIRYEQSQFFHEEIQRLKQGQALPRHTPLKSLCPFLDGVAILRVGGRFERLSIPENEKHPLILPKGSRLSELLITFSHELSLHSGALLTHAQLQKQVWMISSRNQVKKYVRSCVICFKAKPKFGSQQMGQLPPARLIPSRPFLHSGLDYAGPIL